MPRTLAKGVGRSPETAGKALYVGSGAARARANAADREMMYTLSRMRARESAHRWNVEPKTAARDGKINAKNQRRMYACRQTGTK